MFFTDFSLKPENRRSVISMVVPNGHIHPQKKRPKGMARANITMAGQYAMIKVFADIMALMAESGLILRNILPEESLSVRGSIKRSR
jgi:hypothetical protein